MKRPIFRLTCAFSLSAPLGVAAVAQTPPSTPSAVVASTYDPSNEIVVVANRAPEPLSTIGNSVTVLDSDVIKESQQTLVSDVLAQTPGISIARNGGVGQLTSVFIRGAESDQTVVVIDGVQLNDPSAPAGNFNFANLLTSDVSKIEILRGAQSTLYGSQAMGGIVNVLTAEPTGPFGAGITAEGGSHDTGYMSANAGGKSDALLWRLSGNWYGTSGIPAFDEKLGGTRLSASQIGGGSGQLRYDLTPDLKIDLRGYYSQARTDFDGYDTPTGNFGDDNEYGKSNQFLGYAGFTLSSPDRKLTDRVAFQYTDTESRNYDPNAPVNYGSPTTLTFFAIGRNEREEYQGTWEIAPGIQAVFGAQHERSTIDTYSAEFQPAPPRLTNDATIDSGYAQLQAQIFTGFTLTLGERYDRHDIFGGHSTGQIAAAWVLGDSGTLLRASFGQGFKAPSLYQLFSEYGNLALRPESAHSWDAGVERHALSGRLLLSAAYYQRASRDLIDFFYCTTTCLNTAGGYYANVAKAAAHGVELQAALTPIPQLTLAMNYTLTETEDQSVDSPTFGKELPQRPKHAANASATYRGSTPWSASVAARYAGLSFGDQANDIELGGYVLLDLRATYSLRDRLEVYARLDNATGKHYETVYQYGTLGRVAYAGVRVTF